MPTFVDRTGRRFGRLTVVEREECATSQGARWVCLCDCGTTKTVTSQNLQSGNTRSCGCLQRDEAAERHRVRRGQYEDLAGKRYGRWKVLSFAGLVNGKPFWNCLCTCGKMRVVMARSLQQGKSNSCGCQRNPKPLRLGKPGERYGRLVLLHRDDRRGYWVCQCDCGGTAVARIASLRNGHTRSCGCFRVEQVVKAVRTHGQSATREYVALKARERLERKRALDTQWSLEMDNLLRELQPTCVVCDAEEGLSVDHVLPLSKGHGLQPGNAVILCGPCNTRKLNHPLEDLPPATAQKILTAAGQFKEAWEARQ